MSQPTRPLLSCAGNSLDTTADDRIFDEVCGAMASRSLAETITESVGGVRDVYNELRVGAKAGAAQPRRVA